MRPVLEQRRGTAQRGRDGSTVTEFAALLPLLMLVIFGVLEGGRMMSVWVSMDHVVRQSARLGAVAIGDPARQPTLAATVEGNAVDRLSSLGLNPARLTVTVAIGAPPTGVVDVAAAYVLDTSTPMIEALLPAGFTLRAHSAMRVE